MPDDNKTKRVLKLILYLSAPYGRSKQACIQHLGIGESSFYEYLRLLREIGFHVELENASYMIRYHEDAPAVFQQAFHMSEEDGWLLARAIDSLDTTQERAFRLKRKLLSFVDKEEAIATYIQKEKSQLVLQLKQAMDQRKQVMLESYASGNSQSIRNRIVEPFEFRDDFGLLWAFDTSVGENRQFKVSRIAGISLLPYSWENTKSHRALPVDMFRNTGILNKRVQFSMNLRAKNLLIEEYPLAEKWIRKIQNRYQFDALVSKYEGPGRFVTGLPEDIQVFGDPEFCKFLKMKFKLFRNLFHTPDFPE